jgi:hypothetical protein
MRVSFLDAQSRLLELLDVNCLRIKANLQRLYYSRVLSRQQYKTLSRLYQSPCPVMQDAVLDPV